MSFSRHANLNPVKQKMGRPIEDSPSLVYRFLAIPRRVALQQSPTPLRQDCNDTAFLHNYDNIPKIFSLTNVH